MYIQMSPWAVAILIELIILAGAASAFFYYRFQRVGQDVQVQLDEAAEAVEAARAEVRRVQEEAMRKRTIVTFDDSDLEKLIEAGEMAGDPGGFEALKTKIIETVEVLNTITGSAADLNGKLAEVMEKQMEAVNMVGRLGGTGGLPPELKEKAEAILDVFRTMDEILSGAYEEMDRVESGLGEVSAAVADFRDADPKVKLPTSEVLNLTLKSKVDSDADIVESSTNEATEVQGDGGGDEEPHAEPPLDAFDAIESEQALV